MLFLLFSLVLCRLFCVGVVLCGFVFVLCCFVLFGVGGGVCGCLWGGGGFLWGFCKVPLLWGV